MRIQRFWQVAVAAAITLVGLSGGASSSSAADLSQFLSPDFCGVMVIHPQRISESTLAVAIKAGLPKSITSTDPVAAAAAALKKQKDLPPGMDPDKLAKLLTGKPIRRVTILIEAMPSKTAPAGPALIVEFTADVDGDAILSAISSEWQSGEANGQKYKKLKSPKGEMLAALAPDNRMLIFGLESMVVKMLAKEQGDRPLLKQLQHASFDNDVILEYYAAPMWAGIAKTTGMTTDETLATLPDPASAAILKDVKSVSVRINFSGKTLLKSEVETGKPETAETLAKKGLQSVAIVKMLFESLKKNPPQGTAVFMPMIAKVGDEAFQGLEIKAEGTQMTVNLPMPDSLEATLKTLAQVLGPLMPAPAAAGGQ